MEDDCNRLSRRKMIVAGLGAAAFPSIETGNAASTSLSSQAEAKSRRPNILFILADDLGYADLSCFGRRDYETPHIDKLAADGLKLTDCYSNAALCSPTRFALATGRYQYRLPGALDEPLGNRQNRIKTNGLPDGHPTLAGLLRDAGYNTGLVGKWHLGYMPYFSPMKNDRYEYVYGLTDDDGDLGYYVRVYNGEPVLHENGEPAFDEGYVTDVFSQKAIDFISRQSADAPFFLSLHYTANHFPWEPPNADMPSTVDKAPGRFKGQTPKELAWHLSKGSNKIYGDMTKSLDAGVGRVLDGLAAKGFADNTIVVFTSDNGGERFSDMWPFTGHKLDLLEGGVRVPGIVRWPEKIRPGTVSNQAIVTMDWLPTLMAAVGGAPAKDYPSDGENLLPVLTGAEKERERTLFWRAAFRKQAAVRSGGLKYYTANGHEFLFDLDTDPRERANLKNTRPEAFKTLRERWLAWNATMLPITKDVYTACASSEHIANWYGDADCGRDWAQWRWPEGFGKI